MSETAPRLPITGVMAAGSSTVAQALAERLPKGVHLRGGVLCKMDVLCKIDVFCKMDVLCKMIVSGRAAMTVALCSLPGRRGRRGA